jgi:hypothetical protein
MNVFYPVVSVKKIWCTVQIMNLLSLQLSPISCYFLSGPNIVLSTLFSKTLNVLIVFDDTFSCSDYFASTARMITEWEESGCDLFKVTPGHMPGGNEENFSNKLDRDVRKHYLCSSFDVKDQVSHPQTTKNSAINENGKERTMCKLSYVVLLLFS